MSRATDDVDDEKEQELNQFLLEEASKAKASQARKEYLARLHAEDPYWKKSGNDINSKSASLEQGEGG